MTAKKALGMGLDTLFRLSGGSNSSLEGVRAASFAWKGDRIELVASCAAPPEHPLVLLSELARTLSPAWEAYQRGVEEFEGGKIKEAKTQLELAIAHFERCADFHYALGLALDELGESATAINSFRRSLELNPEDADAWVNLAVSLHSEGKLASAQEALQRALAIHPDHTLALENWKLLQP